jgi:hypothetical protein
MVLNETHRFLSIIEGSYLPGFDVSPAEYDAEMRKADRIQRSRMDNATTDRIRTYDVDVSGLKELRLRNGDVISLFFKNPLYQLKGGREKAILEVTKDILRKRYGDKLSKKKGKEMSSLIAQVYSAIKHSKFEKVERN